MLLFPIGTDRPQRLFPWMNVLLIAANVVIYFLSHSFTRFPAQLGVSPYTGLLPGWENWILSPQHPALSQFITYQFLHEGLSHILFNMLFLYVFGNNLNEKLGHLGYLAFYLTGGVLAGCGQLAVSSSPTLGASGAISAVTGLFLVLLPRTHIRMFFSLFFLYVDIWEIPSMYFILFKVGEDIFEQIQGGSHVAYMAHISGTAAGFLIGLLLIMGRLVQRDHYDLLAMFDRYRRRKTYESLVAGGYDPFRGTTGGGVAKLMAGAGLAAGAAANAQSGDPLTDPRIDSLRTEIARLIRLHELPDATQRYLELRAIDPNQVLPPGEQLDVSNQLMADARYAEAAAAYEDFLRLYPTAAEKDQITLILGLIYARYYPRPERARTLFLQVLPRLHDAQQRALAEGELQRLPSSSLGGGATLAGDPTPPPPPSPPPAANPSTPHS